MLQDTQGLEVTTDSQEVIAGINSFTNQALGYGKDAQILIGQLIASDPTCALVHAYAAAYYLSQENATAWKQAKSHLQTAQRHVTKATEREQLYVRAIAAWGAKKIDLAIPYGKLR
jgi:hypothetical protein